jgi:hypothetical protein
MMRFDLRLHGRTSDGKPCRADVSVYASSQGQLQQEAAKAAESAPWRGLDGQEDWIPEGAAITVERVELLREPSK